MSGSRKRKPLSGAARQMAYRKRQEASMGRKPAQYLLTDEEKKKMDAFLAGLRKI